jgi:hypothetical protein
VVLGLFEYSQIGILKETTVAIFDLSIRTFLHRARNYGALLHTHDRYSHTYGAVATVGRDQRSSAKGIAVQLQEHGWQCGLSAMRMREREMTVGEWMESRK